MVDDSDIIENADSVQTVADTEQSKRSVSIRDWLDLYTRPRVFFSSNIDLGERAILLPIVWIIGISAQLDRIDTEIFSHELGNTRASWDLYEPAITGSWGYFWGFCLTAGLLSGLIVYVVGGWWYRMRLRFSGAPEELDFSTPRHVYAWVSTIVSVPYVLLIVGFTFAYPNYYAAYHSDELFSTLLPMLMFWSVAVSYVAATTRFSLSGWKPMLWFMVLPALFYLIVMGALVFLMTLFT